MQNKNLYLKKKIFSKKGILKFQQEKSLFPKILPNSDFWAKSKTKLSYQFCFLRRLVFSQSTPLHPVSESKGGSTSTRDRRTKDSNSCVHYLNKYKSNKILKNGGDILVNYLSTFCHSKHRIILLKSTTNNYIHSHFS